MDLLSFGLLEVMIPDMPPITSRHDGFQAEMCQL